MDDKLMKRTAKGDRNAFAALMERHQQDVLRFAWRFLGSQDEAEDLAQEVFVKIYQQAKNYKTKGAFRSYLFRIVTNECLNRLRRLKKMQWLPLDEEKVSGSLCARAQYERKEIIEEMQKALDQLPERQRLAFLMKIYGNLNYQEIGESLGCSRVSVEGLVFRARRSLQQKLQHLESFYEL